MYILKPGTDTSKTDMQILKADIKRSILKAAREEFAEKGFAKASMRHIASAVGVRVGNLYNYFSSKDELFNLILQPVISSLYAMLDNHHDVHDREQAMLQEDYLKNTVKEYIRLLEHQSTLMEILLFKAQGSSLENFKSDFTDRATEQVRSWINHNGEIFTDKKVDATDFMIHLHIVYMFTMMEEILMHRIRKEALKQIIQEYVKIEILGWKHIFQLTEEGSG